MDPAEVSNLLFGRPMRLPIALYVLKKEDGLVYAKEAAAALRLDSPNVLQEFKRFVALGMLLRLPQLPQDRRRYYQRTGSQLWKIIEAAERIVNPEEPVASTK